MNSMNIRTDAFRLTPEGVYALAPAAQIHSESVAACEYLENQLCEILRRRGTVDEVYKIVESEVIVEPAIDSSSVGKALEFLEGECELQTTFEVKNQEGGNIKVRYETEEFSLLEMIAEVSYELEGATDSLIEDYEIVGGAVPYFTSSVPGKISQFKDVWTPDIQKRYGKNPNDYDLRLILRNGSEEKLEQVYTQLGKSIGKRVKNHFLSEEQLLAMSKKRFFTKKKIILRMDEGGRVIGHHMILSFTPKGRAPIDILIVNKMTRKYQWTSHSGRLSFKGFVIKKKIERFRCHGASPFDLIKFIGGTSRDKAQAMLERAERIISLDSMEDLDLITALPSLLSSYLRGYRIVDKNCNLDVYLFENFIESCFSYKLTYENRNDWVSRVLALNHVRNSSHKHIYVLIEAMQRFIASHHQDNSESLVCITLLACQMFIQRGREDEAPILWQLMTKMTQEKDAARQVEGMPSRVEAKGSLGDIKKILDADVSLLNFMLLWLEVKAIHGLFQESDSEEWQSTILKHNSGYAIRMENPTGCILSPFDPVVSIQLLCVSWEELKESQKVIIERFCTKYSFERFKNNRKLHFNWSTLSYQSIQTLPKSLFCPISRILHLHNIAPDCDWLREHWEGFLHQFEASSQVTVLETILNIYTTNEERQFITHLMKMLSQKGASKENMLFCLDHPKQVLFDFEAWKKARKEISHSKSQALDKSCFDRVSQYRPDIASEILAIMLSEGMKISDAIGMIKTVCRLTLKVPDNKRSWSRLKKLLREIDRLKGGKNQFQLTQESGKELLQLTGEMIKGRSYDQEMVELVLRIIEPKNVSVEQFGNLLDLHIANGDSSNAVALWTAGERYQILKNNGDNTVQTTALKLVSYVELSLENWKLFSYLAKMDGSNEGIVSLMDRFMDVLEAYKGEWTHDHSKELMSLLRLPYVLQYLKQTQKNYFPLIYGKIAHPDALQKHQDRILAPKEKYDFVEAILAVGYLVSKDYPLVRSRIAERLADTIRMLYQVKFLVQTVPFLRMGLESKKPIFTKVSDAEMLSHIILEAQDFHLFAQYHNLLINIDKTAFKSIDAKAMEWIQSASLEQWGIVYANDSNETIGKTLWHYVCRMLSFPEFVNVRAIAPQAIRWMTRVDRKRISDLLDCADKICEVQGDNIRDVMKQMMEIATSSGEQPSKAALDKLWKVRAMLANRFQIPFGKVAEWINIDKEIVNLTAELPNSSHHNKCYPLLLEIPPSLGMTRLIAKSMDDKPEDALPKLLSYLEKLPPSPCNLKILFSHPQFQSLVPMNYVRSLGAVQNLYEFYLKEKDYPGVIEIIAVAIITTKGRNSGWFHKFIDECVHLPPDHPPVVDIIKQYEELFIGALVSRPDADAALYTLLARRPKNTILPQALVDRYLQMLLNFLPTLDDQFDHEHCFEILTDCLLQNSLQNASPALFGRLLTFATSICIAKKLEKYRKLLFDYIIIHSKSPGFFDDSKTQEHIGSIFSSTETDLEAGLAVLLEILINNETYHPVVLKRLNQIVEISKADDPATAARMQLFFNNIDFLRTQCGDDFVADHLLGFITTITKPSQTITINTFILGLALPNMPKAFWIYMYMQLTEAKVSSQSLSDVIKTAIAYIIKSMDSPDLFDNAVTHLFCCLHFYFDITQSKAMSFLDTPGFLDHLLTLETKNPSWKVCCFRYLSAVLAQVVPQNHENWIKYKPKLQEFVQASMHHELPSELKTHLSPITQKNATILNKTIDMIEVGRWGTQEEFLLSLGWLEILFRDGSNSDDVIVVFMQIPFLMSALSLDRQRIVAQHTLSLCSTYYPLIPFDKNAVPYTVLSKMFEILRATVAPDKIVSLATEWVEGGSVPFAILLSDFIYSIALSKFPVCENSYYFFVTKLASRTIPISIDHFQLHCALLTANKRLDFDKDISLTYYIKYHEYLLIMLAPVKEFGEDHVNLLWDFVSIVYAHLHVHYKTVYAPLTNAGAPPTYDASCLKLLDIIYEWNLALQMHVAKGKGKKCDDLKDVFVRSHVELVTHLRRLTSTGTEYEVLLCYYNFKFTMSGFQESYFDDLYTGTVASLCEVVQKVLSPREMYFALQVFEELCFIEKGTINLAKSKVTFNDLVVAALKKPAISSVLFTHKTFVFIFSHIVLLQEEKYKDLTPSHIWSGCEQIVKRTKDKLLTNNRLPFDLLVPMGMKEQYLNTSLTKLKLETFTQSPDHYLELWFDLFKSPPQGDHEKLDANYFAAMDRMIMTPSQLQQYGTNLQNWLPMVAQTLARGNLHMLAREQKPINLLQRQMVLYRKAITHGYYDQRLELIFFSLASWALEWVEEWDKIQNIPIYKQAFLGCLSMLSEKNWPDEGAQDRERSFMDLFRGIMTKDPTHGSEFISQLCAYWKPIVKTNLPDTLK